MSGRRIYLASNFKNRDYPAILTALRDAGHHCFDFRSDDNAATFGSDQGYVDPNWAKYTPDAIRKFEPTAVACFSRDYNALSWASVVVGIYPAGISATAEVFWAAGQGKRVIIYLGSGSRGELMFGLLGHGNIVTSIPELLALVNRRPRGRPHVAVQATV
jgi:hypothetical protein